MNPPQPVIWLVVTKKILEFPETLGVFSEELGKPLKEAVLGLTIFSLYDFPYARQLQWTQDSYFSLVLICEIFSPTFIPLRAD